MGADGGHDQKRALVEGWPEFLAQTGEFALDILIEGGVLDSLGQLGGDLAKAEPDTQGSSQHGKGQTEEQPLVLEAPAQDTGIAQLKAFEADEQAADDDCNKEKVG